jgi:hypothetical protein
MLNTYAFRASFNMTAFCTKLATLGILFLTLSLRGYALPPLGLTQVSVDSTMRPNLELIDGTAYGMETNIEVFNDTTYISDSTGVWIVDELGHSSLIGLGNPTLGVLRKATRVVEGPGNELYVAADFLGLDSIYRPALFSLDQPTNPLVTWSQGFVGGVRSNLEVLGTSTAPSGFDAASRFLPDGSVERFEYPPSSGGNHNSAAIALATPSGYGIGYAVIPGTIGAGVGVWDPDGNFEWLAPNLGATIETSIRDRHDGTGPNIGWDGAGVQFGQEAPFLLKGGNGSLLGGNVVIVSQGDFVVIDSPYSADSWGFYPGILPGYSDRALPLSDIFPELSTLSIDAVRDITTIDGYLYMALESDGQLYLFGARDPSVIPEPAGMVLMLLGTITCLVRRCRHF